MVVDCNEYFYVCDDCMRIRLLHNATYWTILNLVIYNSVWVLYMNTNELRITKHDFIAKMLSSHLGIISSKNLKIKCTISWFVAVYCIHFLLFLHDTAIQYVGQKNWSMVQWYVFILYLNVNFILGLVKKMINKWK